MDEYLEVPPLTGAYLDRVMTEIESIGPPRCEAAWPGAFGDWLPMCDRPATGDYRYACVHEHVVFRVTCDRHAPRPGVVGCRRCFEAGHECKMRAELVETFT